MKVKDMSAGPFGYLACLAVGAVLFELKVACSAKLSVFAAADRAVRFGDGYPIFYGFASHSLCFNKRRSPTLLVSYCSTFTLSRCIL